MLHWCFASSKVPRSFAWRNEVERRLKQLEAKLEKEQNSIEGDQLDAEMAVNKNLRTMQRDVEGELAGASREATQEVGTVVHDIQGKMSAGCTCAECSSSQIMKAWHKCGKLRPFDSASSPTTSVFL